MRHYYRFMELEPVMEQEEDSVGEASPTSSMGSPSFSPPPDAWTQLGTKDFHDPLLQEHLDLQRAYRLLEVQVRKCDSRASRDLQKMKDALPVQERLRDELQRAREREAALRGEIYDLHEQNELLEFRILELEECQENATTKSRDVATETDAGDVTDATSLPAVGSRETTAEEERIQERLGETSETTSAESATHDSETRLAPDKPHGPTATSDKLDSEQPHSDVPDQTDETSSSSHPRREEISCTLCRRLPRRRSFPEPSEPPPSVEDNQLESLRKSKSEGEIIARQSPDPCEVDEKGDSAKKLKDLANVKKLDTGEGGGQVHRCVGTHVSVKEEGVQAELGSPKTPFFTGRVEDQVRTMRGMLVSIYQILQETRVEVECTNSELREEVQTLEDTLQRLSEEAVRGVATPSCPPTVRRSRSLSFSKDCYCCSQDLQPALEEVISKLHRVMDMLTDPDYVTASASNKAEEKKEEEPPNCVETKSLMTNMPLPDIQVGEIIVKYDDKENKRKEKTDERMSEIISTEKSMGKDPVGVSETWKAGGPQPTQTKDKISPPPRKKKTVQNNVTTPPRQRANEATPSRTYEDEWKPEPPRNEEYDFIRQCFEHQSQAISSEEYVVAVNKGVDGVPGVEFADPRERFREYEGCTAKGMDEAIRHLEELTPLPEEKTVSTTEVVVEVIARLNDPRQNHQVLLKTDVAQARAPSTVPALDTIVPNKSVQVPYQNTEDIRV